MVERIRTAREMEIGDPDELRDRLGPIARWSANRVASVEAAGALREIAKARVKAQSAIALFGINNSKEAILGSMAASAVVTAGAIETKLATNGSSALDALGALKTAGFIGAYEARQHNLRELAQLVERGVITAAECEELMQETNKQLEERKGDIREIDAAARQRMKTIINAGGHTRES